MTKPLDDAARVFRSVHHPGTKSYPHVFSQRVIQPISVLFLPLMLVTVVIALRFEPILYMLYAAFPAALVAAFLWTAFKLRREIAEIRIYDQSIVMRSTHDIAWNRDRLPKSLPLFDIRDYGGWLVIAAGDSDYMILRGEWSCYEELRASLRRAVYE